MENRTTFKICKAEKLLVAWIKENFNPSHWVYADFVTYNGFAAEVKGDRNIDIHNITAEQLYEYAREQITANIAISTLLGY